MQVAQGRNDLILRNSARCVSRVASELSPYNSQDLTVRGRRGHPFAQNLRPVTIAPHHERTRGGLMDNYEVGTAVIFSEERLRCS